MNVENIGAALKRKLGPLPVWVWALIGGGVLYFLRSKGYFGGGIQQGETLQPSQAPAGEPQAQTTLEPGESVYDPNTGALTTAPGGDTGSDDVQNDNTDTLLAAILAAVKAKPTTKKKPKPSDVGHHHHKSPKRKPKKKPGHEQKPGHAHKNKTHKKRPRGHATVKWRPAHKKSPKTKSTLRAVKPRTPQAHSASGPRQRRTVPMVTHTSHTQHPVSAHSRAHKAAGHSPPRPSSPPPRHHRTPKKRHK